MLDQIGEERKGLGAQGDGTSLAVKRHTAEVEHEGTEFECLFRVQVLCSFGHCPTGKVPLVPSGRQSATVRPTGPVLAGPGGPWRLQRNQAIAKFPPLQSPYVERVSHHLGRLFAVVATAVGVAAAEAQATTIHYEATDLTDVVGGEDLWRYAFTLSDFPHGADYGFTIVFDLTLYTQLEDPPPAVNADWDPITIQPDLLLPDDGYYDALALAATPSLDDPFVVDFVWLGTGTPGAQPFGVYDPTFAFIETGTTAALPEPTTAALLALALGLLGGQARRESRSSD